MDLRFVERALDNRFDAVGVVSDDLIVQYWNGPLAALSGIEPHRAIGQTLSSLAPGLRGSALEGALHEAFAGNPVAGEPPFLMSADPTAAHRYEWSVHPLAHVGLVRGAAFVARSTVSRGVALEQMAEAEQRFRAMADCSPVLLWMAGTDALCNFFNDSWLAFSGRRLEEEVGFGWIEGVHPLDLEACMSHYMECFSARIPFEMEYRLRRHDGAYRWILDRGTPRYTPGGAFAGYVGSCVDITERREAEEAARMLADDLARANAYMKTLLYGASHDLKEPIRTVATFTERLQEHATDQLDDDGRRYLEFIREGSQRMRELVDSLLELARVREQRLHKREVSLSELVEVVRLGFRAQLSEGAVVEVGPLPNVNADRELLRSVFENVISNALKFHRAGEPPHVSVSGVRRGEQVIVEVKDRGVGFDPRFADKAFSMFGRLHTRREFPGSGVGLALASDIVVRHGGKMWVESEPDVGTSVFIALELA